MKKQNGITLIALIITIIIIVILAAVTISSITGGGIIEQAGLASTATQNAISYEKSLGYDGWEIGGEKYDSIDDYLKDNPSEIPGAGEMRISYDYDQTQGIYETTVNLYFEIVGKKTYEQYFAETDLEKIFATSIRYSNFNEFIQLEFEGNKNNFIEYLNENYPGLTYQEALLLEINPTYLDIEYSIYILNLRNKGKTELEEILAKNIGYADFNEWIETEYNSLESNFIQDLNAMYPNLTYEDALRHEISQLSHLMFTVTISNGQIIYVSYKDLQAGFEVYENGVYTVTATDICGAVVETTIEINNLVLEIATNPEFFTIDMATGRIDVVDDTSDTHDGVGYFYNTQTKIAYLSEENVIIPSRINGRKVEWLTFKMFCGAIELESLIIPNTVNKIGEAAFQGCTGLTEIVIPNSVTTMGRYVFDDCTGLTKVTLSNQLTKIPEFAFWNCTSLEDVTIPNGVQEIDYNAFSGCTSLQEIVIPKSVTSISTYAFPNCPNLTKIIIEEGSLLEKPYNNWGATNATVEYKPIN